MTNHNDIQELRDQLAKQDERLKKIESLLASPQAAERSGKQQTLRELIKGYTFKNGQEKLAAIIGYYELILSQPLPKTELESAWTATKMDKKYDKSFFERGRDTLFRVDTNGTCVLTQTGETFFEQFLDHE